jgi:hypothetical protein
MSEGKSDEGKSTERNFPINRSITGVFDNHVESPPGSPQQAVTKKPQVRLFIYV